MYNFEMSHKGVNKVKREEGLITKKTRHGHFVRPSNRPIRLEHIEKWKKERKGWTRSFFADESGVVIDPAPSTVTIPADDAFGHIISQVKHPLRVGILETSQPKI